MSSNNSIPERLKRRAAAALHRGDNEAEEDDNSTPILMSNLQVMEMMQKRVEARNQNSMSDTNNDYQHHNRQQPLKRHKHRDWIEQQVVNYVSGSTAAAGNITASAAAQLQQRLRQKPFELTEAEALQVINWLPQLPVELQLFVEDVNDRMTARRQEELLALMKEHCNTQPHQQNGVNGDSSAADQRSREDDDEDDRKAAAVEKTNGTNDESPSPKKKSRWR